MHRWLILTAPVLLCCLFTTAKADIYTWMDENGVRHYTNYAPPPQAKVVLKTEELPYDDEADEERMQTQRLDQLTTALQAAAEKEAQLAEMQLAAEKRIEDANRKAQEALEEAESLLNQARYESYGSDNSGYGSYGFYPYNRSYNHFIYNRWYYRNSGSIFYQKHHHKYRHKHYYKKRFHYKKRHDYKYRGTNHRRYQFRKIRIYKPEGTMRDGFSHRRRTFGQTSFSFSR